MTKGETVAPEEPAKAQGAPEDDAASRGSFAFDAVRELPRSWTQAAAIAAGVIALLHIYFPFSVFVTPLTRALFDVPASPTEILRNAIHFGGFAVLAAITTPIWASAALRRSAAMRWIDFALGLLVAASAIYITATVNDYFDDSAFTDLQWVAGWIAVIGALELTRRTSGPIVPGLAIIALTYLLFWGPYAPSPFTFAGISPKTALVAAVYEDSGMFGVLATISAETVFLFIIFGAFLVRSGAGDFVVALARALAGRLVGGPGLIAVIASGLTGTISGSAVANTASTGVITIPLMKRAGFPARFAAGVEASASTGGQLMPPIMGAGAFVMASYTQLPYGTIIAVAALPALLYFASVAMFVRIEARKQGLQPLTEEHGGLIEAVRDGGASFIIPIGIVISCLVVGFTPPFAAVIGIAAIIVSSWLTRNPMGPRAVWEALVTGGRNMMMMAVLLCTVGLVVNAIVKAGVGNTFSLMIVDWSQGSLLIAIVLVALASLVLGMGLPVTAAYIVLATLSAPALAGMIANADVALTLASGPADPSIMAVVGLSAPDAVAALAQPMTVADAGALVASLPFEIQIVLRDMLVGPETAAAALLSAHMIVFWLSQDSNVTPPVCLAAFTAAAIAKSPPMATGLTSWKIAKGLYIVPVLFAYTPFLSGDWLVALQIFGFSLVGIYALAGALEGWMEGPLPFAARPISAAAGVAAMWPESIVLNLVGVAVTIALFSWSLASDNGSQRVGVG